MDSDPAIWILLRIMNGINGTDNAMKSAIWNNSLVVFKEKLVEESAAGDPFIQGMDVVKCKTNGKL